MTNINSIPMTYCATDNVLVMMGKRVGCLKLMKDEIPEILHVHCVIHRES